MKTLGTIFATPAQLDAADAFADRQYADKLAKASKSLVGLSRRNVGGELRHYRTETTYAIVSRTGKVLWFQSKPDGDYACP